MKDLSSKSKYNDIIEKEMKNICDNLKFNHLDDKDSNRSMMGTIDVLIYENEKLKKDKQVLEEKVNEFDNKFDKINEENKSLHQNLNMMRDLLLSFKSELDQMKTTKKESDDNQVQKQVRNDNFTISEVKNTLNDGEGFKESDPKLPTYKKTHAVNQKKCSFKVKKELHSQVQLNDHIYDYGNNFTEQSQVNFSQNNSNYFQNICDNNSFYLDHKKAQKDFDNSLLIQQDPCKLLS